MTIRQTTWSCLLIAAMVASPARSDDYRISDPGPLYVSSGNFYDSGGVSNYLPQSFTTTFYPIGQSRRLWFTFSEFNLAEGFTNDLLRIYNGNSTAAPLIGEYHGSNLLSSTTILSSASDGSLTFEFLRQSTSAPTAGWSATIHSVSAAAGPPYLDSFHFKGSHNSYERGLHRPGPYDGTRIPLWEQVLRYNCWSIELDLCKKSTGEIVTLHECGTLNHELNADALLIELLSNSEILERFTIMNLEARSLSPCCDNSDWNGNPNLDPLFADLKALFGAHIPVSQVYTHGEFVNIDGEKWPTIQELRRRGKNFAFVLDRGSSTTGLTDSYFFQGSIGDQANNTANEFGRGDGYALSGDDPSPGNKDFFRSFPDRYWEDGPSGLDATVVWPNCIHNHWNYWDINNIIEDFTWEDGTYAPYPIYVDASTTDDERGTLFLPYKTMQSALDRIDRTSPAPNDAFLVKFKGGSYDVSNGTLRLTRKLRLKATPGTTARLH